MKNNNHLTAQNQNAVHRAKRKRTQEHERTLSELNFPAHTLYEQIDGTYLSEPIVFNVSRWQGRHQKPSERSEPEENLLF